MSAATRYSMPEDMRRWPSGAPLCRWQTSVLPWRWPLILIGLLITGETSVFLINLGILLFSAAVLFQLVTLPVEFNASRRAVDVLGASGMLYPDELSSVKKVLGAAALTYVAGAASAILQLLRLLILTGGRRRND